MKSIQNNYRVFGIENVSKFWTQRAAAGLEYENVTKFKIKIPVINCLLSICFFFLCVLSSHVSPLSCFIIDFENLPLKTRPDND